MSIDFKVRLMPNANRLLPSVTRLELDASTYQQLKEWSGEMDILLQEEASGLEFPCQLNSQSMSATPERTGTEHALYVLIKEWSADRLTSELRLVFTKKARQISVAEDRIYNPWRNTNGVFVDHQEENARVVVSIEGKLATRYMYSPFVPKPYYYPLIGPKGHTLIQDAPDDHLHHHGLWWGHDDVNGHKAYHEFRREGRQTHRKFLALFGGPVFGQITSIVDWLDEDGGLLLQETRSVRIYNLPRESRYLDIHTSLHAVNGEVVFGSTKEGGFPFIRVNEQINGFHTGLLTAASGNTKEKGIFGTVTEWVDYSGKLVNVDWDNGIPSKSLIDAGITMFVHPDNEAYASQWFVRDSGAFTSANFHFSGGKTLQGGDSLSIQQRIYVHEGDVLSGQVKERYQEFIEPLAIEIVTS
ncbi:Methane oxygenase PmoA [Paenibacillus sp. 1_12]|uniref:DUF6807 domain-containing protein n=1 Tax=Paenibacillus sp. 1_12 TaxID=1566278 RepID=UPI0008EC1A20|nr:PmoA family protein [Paenibacillus sp. 1_12]SFK97067.1 Methane oxygenase PmoA [Paenibacillus sp. 1_12]